MRSVTIGIPTKNRPEMAVRAVKSAISQRYGDLLEDKSVWNNVYIEIVDGSPLRDAKLSNLYPPNMHPWGGIERYHWMEGDPGPLVSWYLSAAMGTGELFVLNMDDDWLEPDFLKETEPCLDDSTSMVITEAMLRFEDPSKDRPNLGLTESGYVRSEEVIDLIKKMPLTICPSSCLMRREDFLKYMPVGKIPYSSGIKFVADCFMIMAVISSRKYVYLNHKPLANFSAHGGSFTVSQLSDAAKKVKMNRDYAEMKACFDKLKEGL